MCCEQKMNSEDLGKKRSKVEKDWVKAKKAYRGLGIPPPFFAAWAATRV